MKDIAALVDEAADEAVKHLFIDHVRACTGGVATPEKATPALLGKIDLTYKCRAVVQDALQKKAALKK